MGSMYSPGGHRVGTGKGYVRKGHIWGGIFWRRLFKGRDAGVLGKSTQERSY